MSKKEPLFELITSLTMSEKKAFSLFSRSNVQVNDNNYLFLYDAIIKFDVCSDLELQKVVEKQINKKDYSFTKSYLYKVLLKSLNAFHKERISVESELYELLLSIEILHEKSLYDQSLKLCKKGIKKAEKFEKKELLLIFEKWKYQLYDKIQSPFIKNYYPKANNIIKEISNANEYKEVYDRVFDYVILLGEAKNNKEVKVLTQIIDSPLLKSGRKALSLEAKIYFNNAKGLAKYFVKEYQKSSSYYLKSITIFNESKTFKDCNPEKYISCLNNYTINQAHLGNTEVLKQSIHFLKDFVETLKNESLKISTYQSLLALELSYYTSNDFTEGFNELDNIVEIQDKYGNKFNNAHNIFTEYLVAYLYFGSGAYKKALSRLGKILNNSKSDSREDIFVFARILFLITHYELENFSLLEYQLRSIKTFLSHKERNYIFEKETIDLLKELVLNKKDEQQIFSKYHVVFTEYLKGDRHQFGYFDILAWIDSKTAAISFLDSLKNHLLKKV